mgnify:CR=1 FL=1
MGNIREDIRVINERLKKIYILYRGFSGSQGETNKIETVKVNGVALPISNKEVDITIPTDVVIKSEGGLSFKLVVSETGELTTEQIQ